MWHFCMFSVPRQYEDHCSDHVWPRLQLWSFLVAQKRDQLSAYIVWTGNLVCILQHFCQYGTHGTQTNCTRRWLQVSSWARWADWDGKTRPSIQLQNLNSIIKLSDSGVTFNETFYCIISDNVQTLAKKWFSILLMKTVGVVFEDLHVARWLLMWSLGFLGHADPDSLFTLMCPDQQDFTVLYFILISISIA